MNRAILIGRLTDEPKYRDAGTTTVANYTLAVDRRGKKGEADFINITAFGKAADFTYKYFKKGMRVAVDGHIQTGSYTNKEGQKVYTFNIVADNQEFADGKKNNDGFTPGDGWEDEVFE